MKISKRTGVAYDPSCVQHMVRISEANLSKGLVFGVLDVAKREIIWLEMPFTSQIVHYADSKSIEALLRRLEEKISIGELLELKAKGQNLKLAESSVGADEAYTYDWALNPGRSKPSAECLIPLVVTEETIANIESIRATTVLSILEL